MEEGVSPRVFQQVCQKAQKQWAVTPVAPLQVVKQQVHAFVDQELWAGIWGKERNRVKEGLLGCYALLPLCRWSSSRSMPSLTRNCGHALWEGKERGLDLGFEGVARPAARLQVVSSRSILLCTGVCGQAGGEGREGGPNRV